MYLATLRYLKSGLEQFAVDTRRSPKWVLDAHSPDQSAQLRVDLRPPSNQPTSNTSTDEIRPYANARASRDG
jgi:hypothetical protein